MKQKRQRMLEFQMYIDPMTKMNISFVAMGLMFVCNLLMMFARKMTNALLRFVVKTIAFLMLVAIFVMILIVIFV